jgi:hypothetical protein
LWKRDEAGETFKTEREEERGEVERTFGVGEANEVAETALWSCTECGEDWDGAARGVVVTETALEGELDRDEGAREEEERDDDDDDDDDGSSTGREISGT